MENQEYLFDKALDAFISYDYTLLEQQLKNGLDPNYSNNSLFQLSFAKNSSKALLLLYKYNVKHPKVQDLLILFYNDNDKLLKILVENNYELTYHHLIIAKHLNSNSCVKLIELIMTLNHNDKLTYTEIIALIKSGLI